MLRLVLDILVGADLRLGRKQVKWNPKTERFVNDAEADTLLAAPMRGAWTLNMKV